MEIAKILEAMMLLAFGVSWPAQIIKTIRVKNPKGKSLAFLYLVLCGYACGLIGKFLLPDWKSNWVIYIYILDLLMVATDTVLTHYYLALCRKNGIQ